MPSTETNNQPEPLKKAPQLGTSLEQQHSAVSPLLKSITGGRAEPQPTPDPTSEPTVSGETIPPLGEQPLPQSSPAQPASQPEPLSLSKQYGPMGLLAELHSLIETQQFQLEQHREQVLRSRAELRQQLDNWKTRCTALEEQMAAARDRAASLEQKHLASQSQVLPLKARVDAAQQLTERLQAEVLDRRQQQMTLEEQLTLAETTLREQQEITAAQARSIVSMQAELSEAQAAVAILETRLSRQDHLRQQLKADNNRDRQSRSQARSRQLQLEQETTQMTGQLLRLNEELRQSQRQSAQWRRQAQAQAEQLRDISHWAAASDSVPSELMALLAPFFEGLEDSTVLDGAALDCTDSNDAIKSDAGENSPGETSHLERLSLPTETVLEKSLPAVDSTAPSDAKRSDNQDDALLESHAAALNLPSFPQDAV